ncbi:MAG: hypothetical protein ACRYG5_16350 [Janthinobacterium lividum]
MNLARRRPAGCPRYLLLLAALSSAVVLSACSSVFSEGSADVAGVAGAGAATAVTNNAAVAAGIGLGVQSLARVGVQAAERTVHRHEQDRIAEVAGALNVGQVGNWASHHTSRLEPDEQGEVTVSRLLGDAALSCKEIVFSIDTAPKHVPQKAFYVATICRDGQMWKWASAEPAVERWGNLQ